jgi:hypothetical protein
VNHEQFDGLDREPRLPEAQVVFPHRMPEVSIPRAKAVFNL